jgi:hypothetical protein
MAAKKMPMKPKMEMSKKDMMSDRKMPMMPKGKSSGKKGK